MSEAHPQPGEGDQAAVPRHDLVATAAPEAPPLPLAEALEALKPGEYHVTGVKAVVTTLGEHGPRTIMGVPKAFDVRPSRVPLRRELGALRRRAEMSGRPGKLHAARVAVSLSEMEGADGSKEYRKQSVGARLGHLSLMTVGDLGYMSTYLGQAANGGVVKYPWEFECPNCLDRIAARTADVDFKDLKIVTYPYDLAKPELGGPPRIYYRLLQSWRVLSRDVEVVCLAPPQVSRAVIDCREDEWDDNGLGAIRMVNTSICEINGHATSIPDSAMYGQTDDDGLHDHDIDRMTVAVKVLVGGPVDLINWIHDIPKCGNLIALDTDWKTDFFSR